MKNAAFTLDQILAALSEMGIEHRVHLRRSPGDLLRFCSCFAQEDHGIYFWEAGTPPVFEHEDIVVLASITWPSQAGCIVQVAHPQASYYRLMRYFFAAEAAPERAPRIHPTAVVSAAARIGEGSYIGPYCVIGDGEIGADVHLHSHVVVMDGSVIGDRVRIESHSTIGATGVAWVWEDGERIVQPQIGGTCIGDDCFLGTDITIVRGSINEVTTLGAGCVLAHGTKIGHGCRIGDEVHFANNVSIAGNCRIGDRAFLSAASVLRPRITLARGVTVGAGAVVTRDIGEEGVVVSGVPARKMDSKDHHAGVPRAHQLVEGA